MGVRRFTQLLLFLGFLLMVGGVALIYPPAAVILAGVLCSALGVLLATRIA